jgi:hypothetical protein
VPAPTFERSRRFSRRHAIAAAATLPFAAALVTRQSAVAQRMDPYTYIRPMEATTDVGQEVGQPASEIDPVRAEGKTWDAYIQLPIKEGQYFHLSCEFDSSEIVLRAYGSEMSLDEQLQIVGQDNSIEPYYEETADGFIIYGGDIEEHFSGHIDKNILARARGSAVRKVFDHEGFKVTVADTRSKIEKALLAGEPVWFKSTVDFLDWDPTTWVTPDGDEFPVVLTNDHALVVMGFNDDDVIIRDPLGPTSTNETRPWQYMVSWERYLDVIAAQGNDTLAVGPKEAAAS